MARLSDEFEYKTDIDDKPRDLTVKMSFVMDEDWNYGADADGRRGTYMRSFDDLEFKVFDGENDVTAWLEKHDPELFAEIEHTCDERMSVVADTEVEDAAADQADLTNDFEMESEHEEE